MIMTRSKQKSSHWLWRDFKY